MMRLLLDWSPVGGTLIVSAIVSLFSSIVYEMFGEPERVEVVRARSKELQNEMKLARGNPTKEK